MSKMKDMTAACAGTALGITLFLLSQAMYWSAILLHLFTACIIWQTHGIIMGIVALFVPFISEVYAFIHCWVAAGFLNNYTVAVGVVVGLHLLPYLIFALIAITHSEKE